MRRRTTAALAVLLALVGAERAAGQPAVDGEARISWEVKNRFRLFRHESDFVRHQAADRGDGILAAERRLAIGSGGRGWARLMLNGLCVDGGGQISATCERDGVQELYLAPADHRVAFWVEHQPPNAHCVWTFEQVDQPVREMTLPCREEAALRLRYGTPAFASVEIARPDGTSAAARIEILVRDLLIAGLGDSTASGEGNPDRPIALDDAGFCFRRAVGTAGSEYYRPSRSGYRGSRACESSGDQAAGNDWLQRGAGWMSAACHRSLYSYQARTALALALENPHLSVTFVPLACTGAEIESGLFQASRAREVTCRARPCPSNVPAQIPQAAAVLQGARRAQPNRVFDLILLTVGANDVGFSELVGNILLDDSSERAMLASSGAIATVDEARRRLQRQLPGGFAKLRGALKPLVGGDLSRVVYVSYANPAMQGAGEPCPGGRAGVDVHPAFKVNGERLREAVSFVDTQLLPRLKALALCQDGVICKDEGERMSFVDAHQEPFREHGFCARAEDDPEFDRACFSAEGTSFQQSLRAAVDRPLVCGMSVRDFRAYAPRARWIRTPNDSYFAAMTYPNGLASTSQPADIHDALWGVLSAVYGGAIHPTAEGHAAMADAALPVARSLLGLDRGVEPVDTAPLAPLAPGEAPAKQ